MAGTLSRYWKRYESISPWVAMYAYMAVFVGWGIIFLPPHADRLAIAAVVIPAGLVLDHVLHALQTGKPNWQSALITSSIVAVLMPADVSVAIAFLAVILAISSKHVLLAKRGDAGLRHIFNPAGFGVAVTSALFGYSLGWWPDSFVWLTLAFGLLNVRRIKKVPQAVSFGVVYMVLTAISPGLIAGSVSASSLGVQTLPFALPYFFILFMLPEPMTSLDSTQGQVEFGAVAAGAGFAGAHISAVSDAAIVWGLLVANGYAAVRVNIRRQPAARRRGNPGLRVKR